MQLQIYLLSHPILKILSNYIIKNKKKNSSSILQETKILTLLIFYESMRKWVNIKKMYINNINTIQELYIFNPNTLYYLCSTGQTPDILFEYIIKLIPQIQICNLNKIMQIQNTLMNEKNTLHSLNEKHIILFEQVIDKYDILDYLQLLNTKYTIMITQMTILCFTCNNKILDKISQKYPRLKIYTTEIIYN